MKGLRLPVRSIKYTETKESSSIFIPEESKNKRTQNVVLPAYEQTHNNTIEQQSLPKTFYQKSLHSLNTLYHKFFPDSKLSREVKIITQNPFDFKRIAIIGVHGWFPSKLFNPIVGEPSGTSHKIASKMKEAVLNLFRNKHNIILQEDAIEIIPLVFEGLVEQRVDKLFEQFTSHPSWKKTVQSSDLLIFVAHSQGAPVSAMLLSKMIKNGIIDPQLQKTGLLAMAGINHGPYPHLKSSVIIKYVESDPARQLFDFNDPLSNISQQFYTELQHILSKGIRIACIGSWYDQVVPLYSSTLHGISHPHIYRALYIDANDYKPDFLSHLVVFALKLRNKGLSDYSLTVYLSDFIAGNIYGFGTQGHSAIYEELNTYLVGISWIMGTSALWNRSDSQKLFRFPMFEAPQKVNPNFLPFIMAVLLNDQNIKQDAELRKELDEIFNLYLVWQPKSAAFKELRYRLEPIKSKL